MRMRLLLLILLIAPLCLAAEDKPKADAAKKRKLSAKELRAFYTDPAGRIFTEWADMETDTATFRSFTKAGYATVYSEGKMQDGEMVFRKAYKHSEDVYPEAERPKWYTYNGMDQAFFESRNKQLLSDNYTLMQMQRFTDDDGAARFCAVWVKFDPVPKKK